MSENLYILGHPVGHSKSPAMHNAAYAALGLDWQYGFRDCATADEARSFVAGRAWKALNITMPYKPLAFEETYKKSAAATLAHGANVLVNTPDGLLADNTDGIGCVSYLERCGVEFAGARVVVCGTGPTSRAIMHASSVAGAQAVTLMGRDAGKAQREVAFYLEQLDDIVKAPLGAFAFNSFEKLAALRRAADRAQVRGTSYECGDDLLAQADVIVDATSLGMAEGDPAPFDTSLLHVGQTVFDVVYGHGLTRTVADARAAGCAAFDGAGMLVAQAVETVVDIADATGEFAVPADVDLFAIMAQAADFDL